MLNAVGAVATRLTGDCQETQCLPNQFDRKKVTKNSKIRDALDL
ncbi:hypothetical protein Nizo2259_1023 [Lactiplantibacillus plantarum]|uniref:Uncharacterized protein n=1 Tax=Lactiplantibacillus plantarum TaxID=1590 RepID=A0A165DYD7_LACPN|nr:hypothetical protein AWV72_01289 [Lactiplantibacillus plantarum]EFK29784.1 hypothetical protein HMPREF0531_11036 [Lactiplantibacillus plantarum subsp. plantarum ATCC 14917 = JCM 1149 = CGMCC 1.2437]KPN84440.1 hypothetical protein Nizo2877_1373 [Lactiplantibacillus plantarum]KZD98356.1 hypothetical protein FBR6_2156 [Lactiplantibacillus plantarum]KZT97115.1 hypothetical protein Nizo2259_1023 [Lactiplantibacillus plantarum]